MVKQEIKQAQYKATLSVNKELIMLYHGIGRLINEHKSWGSKFIENLATDIKLAFPDAKGYSVRNLKYMAKFAATYEDEEFVQQAVAQIPWGHTVVLLDKVSDGTILNNLLANLGLAPTWRYRNGKNIITFTAKSRERCSRYRSSALQFLLRLLLAASV